MPQVPKKPLESKVVESLTQEGSPAEQAPREGTHPKSENPHAATGPKWQVENSKATPFVNDFFFSHPDKVLGI